MDFRVGGTSLLCMRAPDGKELFNTWTYTKIVPNQRIELTLRFSDKDGRRQDPSAIGLPPGIPKEVPHIITFKAIGRKTEMTVHEFGYTSDTVVQMSKMGLEQCLDKMAKALAKR